MGGVLKGGRVAFWSLVVCIVQVGWLALGQVSGLHLEDPVTHIRGQAGCRLGDGSPLPDRFADKGKNEKEKDSEQ